MEIMNKKSNLDNTHKQSFIRKMRRGVAGKVIEIVVVIVVVSLLFPVAGNLLFNANTTGWDSTSKTIFNYVFLIGLVAVIILLLYSYVQHKKG